MTCNDWQGYIVQLTGVVDAIRPPPIILNRNIQKLIIVIVIDLNNNSEIGYKVKLTTSDQILIIFDSLDPSQLEDSNGNNFMINGQILIELAFLSA